MEALVELSDQLGNPGAAKLFLEAKRRKIKVSRAQVEALVKRQGNRQLFNPVQPSRGKSAAESYSARYQADLADMVNSPSKGFRYFIVLVNVFSREVYAEPLRNKEPVTVAAGLQKLIGALPEKPQVLSTDDGTEFSQHVDDFLQSAGIAHKQHVGKKTTYMLWPSSIAPCRTSRHAWLASWRAQRASGLTFCRRSSLRTTRRTTLPSMKLLRKSSRIRRFSSCLRRTTLGSCSTTKR